MALSVREIPQRKSTGGSESGSFPILENYQECCIRHEILGNAYVVKYYEVHR